MVQSVRNPCVYKYSSHELLSLLNADLKEAVVPTCVRASTCLKDNIIYLTYPF